MEIIERFAIDCCPAVQNGVGLTARTLGLICKTLADYYIAEEEWIVNADDGMLAFTRVFENESEVTK